MVMQWKGKEIANLSRAFLDTNGAVKHTEVNVAQKDLQPLYQPLYGSLREMASSLKTASRRGLTERFDGSIGAGSVLMPFGGKTQTTPAQAMAALFPVLPGQETDQASVMAWGCDPDQMCVDPYTGAHDAVYSSMAKLVAAGADYRKAYLTLQEFFEKLRNEPKRWGKPFAALLGALDAQLELNAAAIGGKDSMSGSFLDLDVPPTVISFAIAPVEADKVLSPEFKGANHPVYLFAPAGNTPEDVKNSWDAFAWLHSQGKVLSAWAVENGAAEAVMKMSFGNNIGFHAENFTDWYTYGPGCLIAELSEDVRMRSAVKIGYTTEKPVIVLGEDEASIEELRALNEATLAKVYPTKVTEGDQDIPAFRYEAKSYPAPAVKAARPKVLIPVFPGTNCEYDSARAMLNAGADAEIAVIRNLTASDVQRSVEEFAKKAAQAQMIFLPGGFSGGDEPDGSAKFITAFFRNPAVTEAVRDLLNNRDGLMLGICNGFQALVKLGLVPYGDIVPMTPECATLTFNNIGRHQSRLVRTRVASNMSPWLSQCEQGRDYTVAISHGEGRFVANDDVLAKMVASGQVATQYVDVCGEPSMNLDVNPNGSVACVEGITSPDGRVFGKMGHVERRGDGLYANVPGEKFMPIFESGVRYFS